VSMKDVSVSRTARRGIRTFSVWVWVWGALVLFVGALNTYAVEVEVFDDVAVEDEAVEDEAVEDAPVELPDGRTAPWAMAEPTVFEPDGITYSGSGGGVIRIPLEEHNQDPYAVTQVSGVGITLYLTNAEDVGQPITARSLPAYVTSVYSDESLIFPHEAELELWVVNDGLWEFTLQEAEITKIRDGFATGTGTGTRHLVYRGDAVSAHFSHRGTGRFNLTINPLDSYTTRPITAAGDVDQRKSWNPASAVYFTIETDTRQDSAWSIDIDELASAAPTHAPLTTTESTPR
jgi:hypothetical protein